jgi:hypothetical protein
LIIPLCGQLLVCDSRYENWIAGKDLGYHPEDDPKISKMSLAPRPSLDEFMANKTNIHELVRKHSKKSGYRTYLLLVNPDFSNDSPSVCCVFAHWFTLRLHYSEL